MFITFGERWQELFSSLNISEALKIASSNVSKYGSKEVSINYLEFEREDLDVLYAKAKEINDRSVMMQVSSFTKLLDNPKKNKVGNLKAFGAALTEYLKKDAINYWIFLTKNNVTLPYFVSSIKYEEPRDSSESPYIVMKVLANSISAFDRKSFSFSSGDVVGKTIDEILSAIGLEHETSELIESFIVDEKRFLLERRNYNKQYKVSGRSYTTSYRYDDFDCNGKAINDEEICDRKITLKTNSKFWKSELEDEEKLYNIPVHPFIYLYSLDVYQHFYAHISNVQDYVYDDTLRDKLILPKSHSDLLDILTEDLSILSGDIIEGKSSGTTILCKGIPGVGKTLTAEAYSEITHRPLFKINSGQLGTSASSVEENLEKYLKMAERWGAVMLIDEADTYIRKRENDIVQNAIVASFLRTLEYFNGLLFMTTNRVDDVDDAIDSRCIATITYTSPDTERACQIWKVLSKQFEIELSDELINHLVEVFPSLTGRDIRELLRLTGRYCRAKNYEFNIQHFVSCAQFRGVEIDQTKI